MDRYVVLTRFFDYNDGLVFATILDWYQIKYIYIGQLGLNLLPCIDARHGNLIIKVLETDWYIANNLLEQYKYDNHLKVI